VKTYSILPLKSEALKFSGFTFQSENLDNVLVVHIPNDSNPDEVVDFRDKLLIAFPDKTVIVVPKSVKFCRIQEVGEME